MQIVLLRVKLTKVGSFNKSQVFSDVLSKRKHFAVNSQLPDYPLTSQMFAESYMLAVKI
jgi:hypothetical protein